MTPSTIRYIELESIPLSKLVVSPPGTIGYYIPKKDESGRSSTNLARIAATAKSRTYKANKRCVTKTVLLVELDVENETPAPIKMLKITMTDLEDISPRSARYLKAIQKDA